MRWDVKERGGGRKRFWAKIPRPTTDANNGLDGVHWRNVLSNPEPVSSLRHAKIKYLF